jgi:ketosteroid isomerase-like protein
VNERGEGQLVSQQNVQTLRDIDEAQARGDLNAFFAHYTDDVKVHVRGNNKLAGDYQGKEQLQALFGRFMESVGNYSFESHSYLADDEHGVTLQTSHMEREGRTLDLQEAFVVHFHGGKVSEMWYFPFDAAAFDAWIGR